MATKIKFDGSDLNKEPNIEENINKEITEIKEEPKKKTTTKKKNPPKEKPSLTTEEIYAQKKIGNVDMLSTQSQEKERMKMNFNNFLPKLNIDLNNIVISDSLNELEKFQNLDVIFNSQPTFEVPLAQSCYTVFMDALKYSDIDTISNSSLDEYHTTLKLYQITYNHIQATTLGKITFDQFLSCTSFFDLQSLFYGLHMQTFPGKTKFDFRCGHCKEKFSSEIPNDTLVFSKDDTIFERFDKIRKTSRNINEIIQGNLLNQTNRICLDQSKTIIDLRIPSLKLHLNTLASIPPSETEKTDDAYTLLFIKNMYLLNVPESLDKDQPIYYQITDDNKKLEAIKHFGVADAKQLGSAIDDWTGKYKVEYKIPNMICPNCGKSLGELSVDMENVLFRLMLSQ